MKQLITIIFLLYPTAILLAKPTVRVVYIVSADRELNSEYVAAINTAIQSSRDWYKREMGGRTFNFFKKGDDKVEVIKSSRTAWSFSNEAPFPGAKGSKDNWGISNAYEEVRKQLGEDGFPGKYTWVIYSDGPGSNGRGGNGVCYMPEDDLLGLIGKHPTQPKITRWQAGLCHEIGHAFGLPHPPEGVESGDLVMGLGVYGDYPENVHLSQRDKDLLVNNPFFLTEEQFQNYEQSHEVVNTQKFDYYGGWFERRQMRNDQIYWMEYFGDGSFSQRYTEYKRGEEYFFLAKKHGDYRIKVPRKGGMSYSKYEGFNDWARHHEVKPLNADYSEEGTVEYFSCSRFNDVELAIPFTESTEVNIENHTESYITYYTVDLERKLVGNDKLGKGRSIHLNTDNTKLYMIQDDQGRCLELFRVKRGTVNFVKVEMGAFTDLDGLIFDEPDHLKSPNTTRTVYDFGHGRFIRHAIGAEVRWTEEIDTEGKEYTFTEFKEEDGFYFARGRNGVVIKIPINGGVSYYSSDMEQWTRNHFLTIKKSSK